MLTALSLSTLGIGIHSGSSHQEASCVFYGSATYIDSFIIYAHITTLGDVLLNCNVLLQEIQETHDRCLLGRLTVKV
jgi:hypothetical protein